MGCDIHIVIQRQEADGTWHEVIYQRAPYEVFKEPVIEGVPLAPEHFESRSYNLFGILANVRNGHGFAGVTTGEGWPSIAPNRGWPAGFSPDTTAPDPRYPEDGPRYLGDHSFTYVTLEELKTYPWDTIISTLYGVVTEEEYLQLATNEQPQSWSGDISGPGIVVYDRPSYLEAKRMNRLAKRPYVRTSWTQTAREATYGWPDAVIPWLEELAAGRPLRLVLGFDS